MVAEVVPDDAEHQAESGPNVAGVALEPCAAEGDHADLAVRGDG